eukprot:540524-Rhodomonas_salina.1
MRTTKEITGVPSEVLRALLANKRTEGVLERIKALEISRRRPGPGDAYTTQEDQDAFNALKDKDEQAAIERAVGLGWPRYQKAEKEREVALKAEVGHSRVVSFAIYPDSLTLRNRLLSYFETLVSPLDAASTIHSFERQARVHACGTVLQLVRVIDAYQLLAFRKWVTDHSQACWSQDHMFVEGWLTSTEGGPPPRWGDEDED